MELICIFCGNSKFTTVTAGEGVSVIYDICPGCLKKKNKPEYKEILKQRKVVGY